MHSLLGHCGILLSNKKEQLINRYNDRADSSENVAKQHQIVLKVTWLPGKQTSVC